MMHTRVPALRSLLSGPALWLAFGSAWLSATPGAASEVRSILQETMEIDASQLFTFAPPAAAGGPLSLQDAVRFAVANDPQIAISQQSVLLDRGGALSATGQFDDVFLFQPSLERNQGELTTGDRQPLQRQRNTFEQSSIELGRVANRLARQLEEQARDPDTNLALANCEVISGTLVINDANGDTVELNCDNNGERVARDTLFDIFDLLGDSDDLDDATKGQIDAIFANEVEPAVVKDIQRTIDTLNFVIPELRAQFDRLGDTPRDNEATIFSLTTGYSLPFRDGLVVTPLLSLEARETNFTSKQFSPLFGGQGVVNTYRFLWGVSLDVPILRGGGRTQVTAAEEASRENLEATSNELRHTIAEAALRTALAYWDLVAAQQTQELLQQSVARQQRLLDLNRELIDADELPGVELVRSQANLANTQSSLVSADRQVLQAQLALLAAMGTDARNLEDLPVATDDFPVAPDDFAISEIEEFIGDGFRRRYDLRAAEARERSAEIISEAAFLELRRRLDLNFTFGYSGFHEDANYADGFENAIFGRQTGPSATISLSWELPFGNRQRRGQLLQARAQVYQSEINRRNLQRIIASRIVDLAETTRSATVQVGQRARAVEAHSELFATELERLQAGVSTVIDSTTTEGQVTAVRIDEIATRQIFARLLSQLRFEAGSLVTYGEADDGRPSVEEILPTGFDFGG